MSIKHSLVPVTALVVGAAMSVNAAQAVEIDSHGNNNQNAVNNLGDKDESHDNQTILSPSATGNSNKVQNNNQVTSTSGAGASSDNNSNIYQDASQRGGNFSQSQKGGDFSQSNTGNNKLDQTNTGNNKLNQNNSGNVKGGSADSTSTSTSGSTSNSGSSSGASTSTSSTNSGAVNLSNTSKVTFRDQKQWFHMNDSSRVNVGVAGAIGDNGSEVQVQLQVPFANGLDREAKEAASLHNMRTRIDLCKSLNGVTITSDASPEMKKVQSMCRGLGFTSSAVILPIAQQPVPIVIQAPTTAPAIGEGEAPSNQPDFSIGGDVRGRW